MSNKITRPCTGCGKGIRVETIRKRLKVMNTSKETKDGSIGHNMKGHVFFLSECCNQKSFLPVELAEKNS